MLKTTRRQRQMREQRQRHWERFSDLVTQWHTWLFLTNWGIQIMTLRACILTVREWPWQHSQFFRCFEANVVKELFGFWSIAETVKRKEIKKKVVKVMSEIIFICEVSIRIRIKFARDVPWRVAPLSAILQPPFHYIHFHLMKIIKCFYKHCNYFENWLLSLFYCSGTWILTIQNREPLFVEELCLSRFWS